MSEKTMPGVVLIGDSIRMGYQQTVVEALEGEAEVWSPQANGGDSRNVLAHLVEWAIDRHPRVVHVNCGLHDLKKDFATGTAQVPIDEYADNVRQILMRLLALEDTRIIWASTTPVDETLHHANKGFDRFEADVQAYNARAEAHCRALGVEIDDLFDVVERAGKGAILREDGVHFSDEGSRILGGVVAGCIRKDWAG